MVDREEAREVELTGLGVVALLAVVASGVLGGGAQSLLGFGGAFLTVPVLAVVAPELLPGAMVVAILPLSLVMVWRGRAHVDVRAAGRLTIGRLPGIVVGAAIVALLPTRGLVVAIALVLVAAVIISAVGPEVPVTPRTELLAGFASGITGTAAALGGPPIGLLYRGAAGRTLRPTLALVWAVGLGPILGSLAVVGALGRDELAVGAVLAAAMLLGLVLAVPLLERVPDVGLRRAILGWAAAGAVLALARALVG